MVYIAFLSLIIANSQNMLGSAVDLWGNFRLNGPAKEYSI